MAGCSTVEITILRRRFGQTSSALRMAALSPSVPQDVKMISLGSAPRNPATFARPSSTTFARRPPNLWMLDALP